MLKELESGWWKGEYILIHDQGPLSATAKTRVYHITSKTGQFLGHIKWMAFWRKYAFFTNNVILEEDCMSDISEFLKMKTTDQRTGWKKKTVVDWDLVELHKQDEENNVR